MGREGEWFDKTIPGPNAYPVKAAFEQVYSAYMESKPMGTFLSKSDRGSYLQMLSDAPGPGRYSIDKGSNQVLKTFAWSKSKVKKANLYPDNGLPGPGAYLNNDEFDREELDRIRNSMRTAGSFRGRYVGKQQSERAPALHTFGADKDRFKNSFCGRLDLKALIPGPGQYELPKLGAGISGGIRFVTSGKGRVPFDPPEPIPGPAYYSPKKIERGAQTQNLDKRWV